MLKIILIISLREIKNTIANHYLLGMTLLLAALSLSLTLLGNMPGGTSGASQLSMQITSLSSLSIFFIPLMALFISYDSIVGENEQGSLLLMLSYPIKRHQFILGKFLANLVSLSLAIVLGYSAILVLSFFEHNLTLDFIYVYLEFILSSVALGSVFISLGYLISVIVAQRSTAIIYCIATWLFFVIFFDMILLIIITSKYSYLINADLLGNILLLNPIDTFRIISVGDQGNNLLPLHAISKIIAIPKYILILSMLIWTILPVLSTIYLFKKKAL
jgi:Cu-processing system permease protein